jgi:hypothetical protein
MWKAWRVYPSEYARLEVEIELGASFLACAFSFAGAFSGLLSPAQTAGPSTPVGMTIRGEVGMTICGRPVGMTIRGGLR